MAEEEVLFEQRMVSITTHRATLNGTMYPITGITAVRNVTIPGSVMGNLFGMALVMLGLPTGMMVFVVEPIGTILTFAAIAVFLVVAGVALAIRRPRTTYVVVLSTAGQNVHAFKTADQVLAREVREHIERAIVRR